jgi:phosphocarrier protein HPr
VGGGETSPINCGRLTTLQTRDLRIANPRGLHAEACARIVDIAKRCRCKLTLVRNGRRVSARNIMAVMVLTATIGVSVRIEADGPDEGVAIREIATLFQDGFGERR